MEDVKIKIDKPPLKLVVGGDVHAGSMNADLKSFEAMIQFVRQRHCKLILMGDLVEGITPMDSRFDVDNVDRKMLATEEQLTYIEQQLEKIKGKLIGTYMGNHYGKLAKSIGNYKTEMCKHLDCHYLGGHATIDLNMPNRTWVVEGWHGVGGGYEDGSVMNRQIKDLRKFEADIYLMGHSHRLFHFPKVRKNGGNFKYHFFCDTGAFLKSYEIGTVGYGEMKGYDPLPIGFIEINLADDRLPIINERYVENGKFM